MRFERIVGGEGPPRIVGVRRMRASRHEEPRPLPELVSETPAPASGARPDAPRVKPASYVVVSLLFSALVFGFFLVNEHGLLQVRRQRLQLAKMQTEVTQLDEDNRRLDAEVAALKNDPNAVEKTAREKLNLVRRGEVVLILPDGWQARVKPPAAPAPVPTPR